MFTLLNGSESETAVPVVTCLVQMQPGTSTGYWRKPLELMVLVQFCEIG